MLRPVPGSGGQVPGMNPLQRYVLAIAAANLAVVLLFPPYDYVSMLLNNIPTFDGFYFVFATEPHLVINSSFLLLEVFVILANAGIAILLLRGRSGPASMTPGSNPRQRRILVMVAINLVIVMLFPPFESYSAITKATLPTFEGFRFVFGDNPMRQIVTPILFIEVALVLINGALLWMLFRSKTAEELSAEQMRDLARRIGGQHKS